MVESQQEILQEKMNWHWRYSMRPARFFALDARAGFFWFIQIFNLVNIYVWSLTLLVTFIFVTMEKRGLNFPSAMRALRSWLVGPKRHGHVSLRRRKMKDYV